jgi:hypothetical protein
MNIVKGLVQKVQTTLDECVRVTIDIENQYIPEGVNVLKWKNSMVIIRPEVEVSNDFNR